MLEKEEVCWIGASREGRRNVGGYCVARLGFRIALMLGRITEDVDIARWSSIAVVDSLKTRLESLEIFRCVAAGFATVGGIKTSCAVSNTECVCHISLIN